MPVKRNHTRKPNRPHTLYAVLGMPPGSTPDALHARFKELALELHPDKQVSRDFVRQQACLEKFTKITAAWAVLKDKDSRKQYDLQLKMIGNQCTRCTGEGLQRQQRGFTAISLRPCTECEGTGQRLV